MSVAGAAPSAAVLRAFGVVDVPRPLAGPAWIAGGLVFKREGGPVQRWLAEALADVTADGCRIVAPIGEHAGWSATRWVEGHPDPSNPAGVLAAGRAFHRAVAHLPRPSCLDLRQDWWARADRAAWGELSLRLRPEVTGLAARLRQRLEPMGRPQLVHCDLLGNVLFAPGLPPAVIDISPYWRPPEYAAAVAVADALCWHGAKPDLLTTAGVSPAAVARALLFRLGTANECTLGTADECTLGTVDECTLGTADGCNLGTADAPGLAAEADRYAAVAAALGW